MKKPDPKDKNQSVAPSGKAKAWALFRRTGLIGGIVLLLLGLVLAKPGLTQAPTPLQKGPVVVSPEYNRADQPATNSYDSGSFFLPPYPSNSERLGYGRTSNHDTTALNAGWYVDWAAAINPGHPGGAEYIRTIYFSVNKSGDCQAATKLSQITASLTGTTLLNNVQANPGALWAIGNEPDSYYNGSPIRPELYAELYHHFYTTLTAADPTAKIATGAIVQASPLRMAYLDGVLTHYRNTYHTAMPVDVWNIHFYRLNEGVCGNSWGAAVPPGSAVNQGWGLGFTPAELLDLNALEQSLRSFRQWLAERGYGDKPLIITEMGVLPPPAYDGFGNDVAAQFLANATAMLTTATDPVTGPATDGHRLVQLWAWFSTDHEPPAGYQKYGGDLFESDNSLTVIGQTFAAQTAALYTPYVDLQPLPPTNAISSGNSLTVSVRVQNRGNITATTVPVSLSLTNPAGGVILAEANLTLDNINRRYAALPVALTHTWQVSTTEAMTAAVPYRLSVTVQAAGDADTANNTLAFSTTWRPLVDLAVTDIIISPGSAFLLKAATTFTAILTVTNRGDLGAPQTTLHLTLQPSNGSIRVLADQLTVPAILPHQNVCLAIPFLITQTGLVRISAALPAPVGPAELYTANNSRSANLLVAGTVIYLPIIQQTHNPRGQ